MEGAEFNLLTAMVQQGEMDGITKSNKFPRDIARNLISAGRDTISSGLTWLFWLVATHPYVEAKILEEIKKHMLDNGKWKVLNIEELNKLVYLHGAICESYASFHLYLSSTNVQLNLIFFQAVIVSIQTR